MTTYDVAPESDVNEKEHRRKIAKVANSCRLGKLNAVTTLTLTANAASTTLTDARITPSSFIGLMPQTANAATALTTTYFAATTQLNGSVVISHANNAQTDRSFIVLIIG